MKIKTKYGMVYEVRKECNCPATWCFGHTRTDCPEYWKDVKYTILKK